MIQSENIYLTDDLQVQLASFTHPISDARPAVHPQNEGKAGCDTAEQLAGGMASPPNEEPLKSPAILIVPGGSYYHCAAHEATPVALYFQQAGYQCFTLHRYSVQQNSAFPRPMEDLALALAYIRLHADRWQIDSNRIIVMGFSAGGHMAASLGNYWTQNDLFTTYHYHDFRETWANIKPGADILSWSDEKLRQPNALILGYAYLNYSGMEKAFQKGLDPILRFIPAFLQNMLKPSAAEQTERGHSLAGRLGLKSSVWQSLVPLLLRLPLTKKAGIGRALIDDHPLMCLDQTVNEKTPPTFLWWCEDDSLVPPQQSVEMTKALSEQHIPHKAIHYPTGGHGLGIACENAHHSAERVKEAAAWPNEALNWLKEQGMEPIFRS